MSSSSSSSSSAAESSHSFADTPTNDYSTLQSPREKNDDDMRNSPPTSSPSTSRTSYTTENDLSQRFNEINHHTSSSPLIQLFHHTKKQARQSTNQWKQNGAIKRIFVNGMKSSIPCIEWILLYPMHLREWIVRDLLVGLTLSILLIPQSLAYALLATLPASYGLYACLLPPLTYTVFGTSKELHIGPFALISLLTGSAINKTIATYPGIFTDDMTTHISIALSISMVVGLLLLCMAVLRLGFIVNFLSTPMLSSFNAAAALLIATSQLQSLLGIPHVPPTTTVWQTWVFVFEHITQVNIYTFLLSIFCITVLFLCDYTSSRLKLSIPIPSQLLVVICSTLIVYLTGAYQSPVNIDTVGSVEHGFPPTFIPSLTMLYYVLPQSIVIALVVYITSISAAKQFAMKNNYAIDNNQEMLALALANIFGSFTSAYPSSASLSRTALVDKLRPATPTHNIISTLIVMLAIISIMPLLSPVPKAALAAVILVALKSLIMSIGYIKTLYKLHIHDTIMWLSTFFSTILGGTEIGLIVGIVISICCLLHTLSSPNVAVLGKLPDTDIYRNIKRYGSTAVEEDGIVIVRYDSPLLFSNGEHFRNAVMNAVKRRRKQIAEENQKTKVESDVDVEVKMNENSEQKDSTLDTIEHRGAALYELKSVAINENGIDSSTGDHRQQSSKDADADPVTVTVYPQPHTLIVDCSTMTQIDTTALHILHELPRQLGMRVLLCNARAPIRDMLQRARSCYDIVDGDHIFVTIHAAVEYSRQQEEIARQQQQQQQAS